MGQLFTNKSQNGHKEKAYIDYSLIIIVLFLLAFGLIMVYSTTSYEASVNKATHYDAAFYLKKQLRATLIGVVGLIAATFFPREWLRKLALPLYAAALVMLLLVKTPLGVEVNGARRWLDFKVMTVQPAEIAKIGLIVAGAYLMCKMANGVKSNRGYWFLFGLPIPLCIVTLFFTDDLSSAAIIFCIGFVMLFVISPDIKRTGLIFLAGVAFLTLLVFLILKFPDFPLWGFRGERIKAWRNPEASLSDAAYQTSQGLYAIGSGGIFGRGIGQSIQKLGTLPEAQNDMVFAVVCEELGLFGGFCIICLFGLMLWRLLVVASNATDLFGGMIVTGVMAHVSFQVLFNIAVVTNILPNTGISLPFISYGGSSVLVLLVEVGLVLNVARDVRF